MRLIKRITGDEKGQSAVIFALALVVLIGIGSFTIDIGRIKIEKSNLQSAVDAAALAGAKELPDTASADNVAVYYAGANGIDTASGDTLDIETNYGGNSAVINVSAARTVEYYFAKVWGYDQTTVTASATAECNSEWDGEALPFVNLDDDYTEDTEIVAWEKTGPGDFESIQDYEIVNPGDRDKLYFKIDYSEGVTVKKGTVATVKQEVGYIYESHLPDIPVYIFSISKAVMDSGSVLLADGSHRSLDKMKNGDMIDISQMVLLKCIFTYYDYQGKTLTLNVTKVYNIAAGEYPDDYVNPDGGYSVLVG